MNEFDPLNKDGEEKESLHRRARRVPSSFSNSSEIAEEIKEAASEIVEEIKEAASEIAEEEKKEIPSELQTEEKTAAAEETAKETDPKENAAEENKDAPLSMAGNIFDWCKSFLFSLTAVIFIFTLLFRGVTVNGGSMLPTLENGEYLIISDLFYTPKQGDIVVVQAPHYKNGTEPLIKRVIATGGQEVKINFYTWEIRVDGEKLTEDYILYEPNTTMLTEDMKPDENGEVTLTVEENSVFLMGDHRNDSLDSRSDTVGQIDVRYIMGRVIVRVTPFDRFGKVD